MISTGVLVVSIRKPMISTGVLMVFYEETYDFDRGFGRFL